MLSAVRCRFVGQWRPSERVGSYSHRPRVRHLRAIHVTRLRQPIRTPKVGARLRIAREPRNAAIVGWSAKTPWMGGCAHSMFTALTHVKFQGECACGHRDGSRPTGHGHADFLTSLNPCDRPGPTGIRPRRNRPHRVGSFSSGVPLLPMSTRCPDGSVSPGSKRTSTMPSLRFVTEISDERIASIGRSVASWSGRGAEVRVDSIALQQCRIRLAPAQRRGSGTEGWLRSERRMEAHETRNASRGIDA